MATVYVTGFNTKLKIKSPYLLVFHGHELHQKININQIDKIILWGRCYLSREVASLARFRQIPVLFIGNQGEELGRLERSSKQKYQCLKYQKQRAFEAEFTFAMAENIIHAKLHNCHSVLQRLLSSSPTPIIQIALDMILLLIDDLPMANSINALRESGVMAAGFYYRALATLLPQGFNFKGRKKQPVTDGINCLLNLGYTLLHQLIEMFLEEFGLHPNWGNLYANCHHHSPLACDLMAEFRAPLVDELVAFLAISEIVSPSDFLPTAEGGVSLHPELLKLFFRYWEEKLQTQLTHPYAGTVTYRHCLQLQVKEYIAYLLANTDAYRPMLFQVDSSPMNIHPADNYNSDKKLLALVKQ